MKPLTSALYKFGIPLEEAKIIDEGMDFVAVKASTVNTKLLDNLHLIKLTFVWNLSDALSCIRPNEIERIQDFFDDNTSSITIQARQLEGEMYLISSDEARFLDDLRLKLPGYNLNSVPMLFDCFRSYPTSHIQTIMDFVYHPESLKAYGIDFESAQEIVEEMRKMEYLLHLVNETDLDCKKVRMLVCLSRLSPENPYPLLFPGDRNLCTELSENQTKEARFVNEFISLQNILKSPQDSKDLKSKITHPALLAVLYEAEKK